MFSLITHVRSWFSTPWKSAAVLAAEQKLACLEKEVEENQRRIKETKNLSEDFSPLFTQMHESHGYFLQLVQPTGGSAQLSKPKEAPNDFIQRVKQMKLVVSIIMATHESKITNEKGAMVVIVKMLAKAEDCLTDKRVILARLKGRIQAFETENGKLDRFIAETRIKHAQLRAATVEVRQAGTPPPKCRSGSRIVHQSDS